MQMFFKNTCVVCHTDKFSFLEKRVVLGLTLPGRFICENCGSIFIEDELKWKLVQIKDKFSPTWLQFRNKSFYVRKWVDIGSAEAFYREVSFV